MGKRHWTRKRIRFQIQCRFPAAGLHCMADVKKQHDLYVKSLLGDIKANPRDFYWYINGQKKDMQGIPPLKRRNGSSLAESGLEQADEFNSQFTDVFNKSRSVPIMEDIHVLAVRVTKLLEGLNPSKALGPDELHPRVLKEPVSEFGPMFAHLFHQSSHG